MTHESYDPMNPASWLFDFINKYLVSAFTLVRRRTRDSVSIYWDTPWGTGRGAPCARPLYSGSPVESSHPSGPLPAPRPTHHPARHRVQISHTPAQVPEGVPSWQG